MAAKIVIKIKDDFFLQKDTFTANSTKLVIGSNFPFSNDANPLSNVNFQDISGIYATMKNADNQSESLIKFQELIGNIERIDPRLKIENCFSVIDNTEVINIKKMAIERTGYVGANMLNFYFIIVPNDNADSILYQINKSGSTLGIEFAYIEGELKDFEVSLNIGTLGPPTKLDGISTKTVKDLNVSSLNLEKLSPSINIEEIPTNIAIKKATIPLKENNLFAATNSHNSNIPVQATNPPLPISSANTVISKITQLFQSCGFTLYGTSRDTVSPAITVVDIEQGWGNTMGLGISGGKYNHTNIDKQNHGKKTLHLLKGINSSNLNVLDGLCRNANICIASTWFSASSTIDYRAAALLSITGHAYTNPITNIASTDTKIVNIGDIILLELQVERNYTTTNDPKKVKFAEFPTEIEPLMAGAINLSIQGGFIIIEPAGNANGASNNPINLDYVKFVNPPNSAPLINLQSSTHGTKAIIVGAVKKDFSTIFLNKGSRINFYCFGEDALTSASIGKIYKKHFNSTSLASALTAALVAHFQSKALVLISRRLTITEIKKLLKNISDNPTVVHSNFNAFLSYNGITSTPPSITISTP